MGKFLSRFKNSPLGLIKRALFKTIIGPLRYREGDDYNAAAYWHDRFSKYGRSIKGPGDEGLSEAENEKIYVEAGKVFVDLCLREGVHFENVNVLEIGCGTGAYTKILHDLGVRDYVGVDIMDVLFPDLREKFSQYKFYKKDITSDTIEGDYDLVVMIDVIQHIVNRDRLTFALENVRNCLKKNGVFIVAPVTEASKKKLFYLHYWSFEDIKQRFPGYSHGKLIPFKDDCILALRKTT